MNKVTIAEAFAGTFAFLRQNWLNILLWIGGAVIVIVVLAGLTIVNAMAGLSQQPNDPEFMGAFFGMIGKFLLFGILASIIIYAAGFMVWRMGLARDGSSGDIGWALVAGALYALAYFVVMMAVYIALYIVVTVIVLLFAAFFGGGLASLTDMQAMATSGGVIVLAIALYIAIIVTVLWFQGRLILSGPIMADRKSINPFSAMAESWRLTKPSQWSIVGFLVVLTIMLAAIAIGFSMVLRVVTGGGSTGSVVGAIIMVLIYVPVVMIWMSVPAGLYRRAVGEIDVAETFA